MGLSEFISGTKQFLISGFRSFPIILAVTSFILAIFQTNIAFILLFVAIAFIVPIANTFVNTIGEFILTKTSLDPSSYQIPVSAVCTIVSPEGLTEMPATIFGLPSYWLATVVFFFSYLAVNGFSLYNRESSEHADKNAVFARKSQAMMGAVLAIVIGLLFIGMRFIISGCEKGWGLVIALFTMIPLAIGWYRFAAACGADRLVDLFGIANGMLPMSAKANVPYVCVKETF